HSVPTRRSSDLLLLPVQRSEHERRTVGPGAAGSAPRRVRRCGELRAALPESARNSDLEALLLAVIRRGAGASLPASEFDALARAVFTHQFACNPIYRAYCEARGKTPTSLDGWEDVPAVPTDAFKAAPLSCGDPAAAEVVFRTSGTTRGSERRGTHYMLDTS